MLFTHVGGIDELRRHHCACTGDIDCIHHAGIAKRRRSGMFVGIIMPESGVVAESQRFQFEASGSISRTDGEVGSHIIHHKRRKIYLNKISAIGKKIFPGEIICYLRWFKHHLLQPCIIERGILAHHGFSPEWE